MKRTVIKQKIKEALTKSTSHGIPNIAGSDHMILKTFWVLFTLAATALCSFLIAQSVMAYYEFEVTTKIRTKYELNFTFPSVTVCNTNFFTTEYAWEFLNSSKSISDAINLAIRNSNNLSELQSYGDSMDKLIQKSSYFDTSSSIGYFSIEDHFTYYFHTQFGNCYTFNSNKGNDGSSKNPLNSLKTGQFSGLDLVLNLSVHEKLLERSSYGAVIFIHEFGSSPISVDPIAISPEQMTLVALQRTRSTQLAKPYSDCEETENFKSDLVKDIKKMNFKYSQRICFELCLHRLMVNNCSCYLIEFSLFTEGEPCLEFANSFCIFVFYLYMIRENYLVEKCRPLCPLECQTVTYTKTISNYYYGSTTSVKIYFESFAITEIEERAVTTIEILLSNIGGIAGLFLGISVLSFVEILSVSIEIILILKKRENKINDEKPTGETSQLEIKSISDININKEPE